MLAVVGQGFFNRAWFMALAPKDSPQLLSCAPYFIGQICQEGYRSVDGVLSLPSYKSEHEFGLDCASRVLGLPNILGTSA